MTPEEYHALPTKRSKVAAPKAQPPIPENLIVNACLRWLMMHGCFVWRNNTGAFKPEGSPRFIRYGLKGSADIIGLTPQGRFLAVECKAGKNDLQDSQREYGEKVTASKGIYIVAWSIDDLEAHKTEILG